MFENITANNIITLEVGRPNIAPFMGTDPEIFALDKRGDVVPAFSFLDNKKLIKDSTATSGYRPENNYYSDGFASELYVPPKKCLAYVVDGIQNALRSLSEQLGKDIKLNPVTAKEVNMKDEYTDDEISLGCMPSFNAYALRSPVEGDNPRGITLRTTGFHIHIETLKYDLYGKNPVDLSLEEKVRLTKYMDRFVGVPSVSLLRGWEDFRRRQYYGLPGEFRTPKHGYEYRAISSAAIVSPIVTMAILELARLGYNTFLKYGTDEVLRTKGGNTRHNVIMESISDKDVIDIMLNLRVIRAKNFTQKFFGIINKPLSYYYDITKAHTYMYRGSPVEKLACLLSKGAKHFISYDKFYDNWMFNPTSYNYWKLHSEATNACLYTANFKDTIKQAAAKGA